MKFFKYLPHILFVSALAYFALLAFVLEKDPMMNKMIMLTICCLWLLWIFAKSLIKIAVGIALLAGICYGGYYVMHAKEIECKKAGREWNAKLEVCEDKKTMGEKLKSAVSNAVKTTLKKLNKGKTRTEEAMKEIEEGNED